jgi:OOP family OmpA-OmpF porin
MKRPAWKSIVGGVLVFFCCAAPTYAQLNFGRIDTSLYLGGAVGASHFRTSCDGVSVSCDDKDTGWKLFAGYQFAPNFAVEAGYTDLGKVTANGVVSGVAVNAEGKARGFELAALALFPVWDQFSIYGKLGVFRAKTDVSATGTVPGFRRTIASSDHSTDLTFGAGVKYAFTPNIGARLEWQRYQKVGGDNTGTENIDLWSLGLLYNF